MFIRTFDRLQHVTIGRKWLAVDMNQPDSFRAKLDSGCTIETISGIEERLHTISQTFKVGMAPTTIKACSNPFELSLEKMERMIGAKLLGRFEQRIGDVPRVLRRLTDCFQQIGTGVRISPAGVIDFALQSRRVEA